MVCQYEMQSMARSIRMVAMTGVITCSPKAPAGIRIVSAASGP
jgi:hypothetical protein